MGLWDRCLAKRQHQRSGAGPLPWLLRSSIGRIFRHSVSVSSYFFRRLAACLAEEIAYPSVHIRRPMVHLGLPRSQSWQDLFVQELPALKISGLSHLDAFSVAIGAKGVPCPVVSLDHARIRKVQVHSYPGSSFLDRRSKDNGR